jgi:hypothetical protein
MIGLARRDFGECEVAKSTSRKFVWRGAPLDLGRYVGLIDALTSSAEVHAYQILTTDAAHCIAVELIRANSQAPA